MTVIAEKDRPTVRDVLARELVNDIELLLFTRGRSLDADEVEVANSSCNETRELLEQLADLSDRIHLTIHDVDVDPALATGYNVNAVPTVIIRKHAPARLSAWAAHAPKSDSHNGVAAMATGGVSSGGLRHLDANVRFVGLPGGYEFSTLMADMANISRGQTELSAATTEAVQAITTPVHMQVFVTPNCPYCPPAARIAHQLAMTNPLILAEVIEANEFPTLTARYRIQTVPKTVINDQIEFVGPLSEAKVLEALLYVVKRQTERAVPKVS
jgi:thiol-disulfide isomerase/thioredoxin